MLKKRRGYDRGVPDFSNINAFDIFSHFFSEKPYAKSKSVSLTFNVPVSIAAICKNKRIRVSYERTVKCPTCMGRRCNSEWTQIPKCLPCHGTGVVQNARSLGFMNFQQSGICQRCNGEGKLIPPELTCKAWEGTGSAKSAEVLLVDANKACAQQPILYKDMGSYDVQTRQTGDLRLNLIINSDTDFFIFNNVLSVRKEITLCGSISWV